MAVTTMPEFVVMLEDKPGTLAELAGGLGRSRINISGHMLQSGEGFSLFRFTAEQAAEAEGWLREHRLPFRKREVVVVTATNLPGEIGRLAGKLGGAGVNIEASYHVFVGDSGRIAFAVDDVAGARKALGG